MQVSYRSENSAVVGFVILSHAYPELLQRLVVRLGDMFDAPPIVCHHDSEKTPLEIAAFPGYVSFIQPPIRTAWADFSLVRAVLAALRALYESERPPQWCFVLSGQDYPVKPASQIIRELQESPFDVWMHSEKIDPRSLNSAWQTRCAKRYLRLHRRLLYINRHGRVRYDRVGLPRQLSRFFVPFTTNYACYAGSFWVTVNKKSVRALLSSNGKRRALSRHYAHAPFPDESYFQTVLENEEGLRIARNDKRYINWSGERAHPDILTEENLDEIEKSSAHFARKVHPTQSRRLLDQLDTICMATNGN